MNDEIKSVEINLELMLNRFPCMYHEKESIIVIRGPDYFALDCGCTYAIGEFGSVWRNTTGKKKGE